MKKIVKQVLFSLGLVALVPVVSAAGDAERGAELVTVCAACHADDGNSPAPAFPKIAGLGEKYLLKQLRDIQAWDLESDAERKPQTGRPVVEMTGMLRNMSDQDLQDIAAFYNSQTIQLAGAREQQVQLNSGVKVDGLALGERIWRAGNLATGVPACTGCHTPSGLGNEPAGFPRLSGQYAEYIEKQLRDFRAGNRTNDGDTMMMRLVAERMSDAEIQAVANFISGLH